MQQDGAWTDVTGPASMTAFLALARGLKEQIRSERGLTATIGIASNKLLAKIASDHKKPDGLTLITDEERVAFLRPLPVRALYGVGKVTEEVLKRAGMVSIGDLQDHAGDLRALVGSFGPRLKQFAFGEDDRPLELGDEVKSISGEESVFAGHGGPEDFAAVSEGAGGRYFGAVETEAARGAHGAGESAVRGFHDLDTTVLSGGAAGGGGRHLQVGMFFAGTGQTGFASTAVAGAWGEQPERAERAATGTYLNCGLRISDCGVGAE